MGKSIDVINWRKRTKERIVAAMGGKCYCCPYNACSAAFDLHHIEPNEKKFSMGGMRANPISWKRIVEELRKCILLCANCHREVEAGFKILKNPKSTFNETYAEYELCISREKNVVAICEECKESYAQYNSKQKYCSDVCYKLKNKKKLDLATKRNSIPKKVA